MMARSALLLALLVCGALAALRFQDEEMMKKHHHEAYPRDGPALTVHLVPHSHDDVGWLKTVDDYFYGANMRTQFAGVQYTIDTVVQELTAHPEYKFTIVEMAFLYRWWNQASEKERQQMRALVANRQLQFVNAGWCMSDEAAMYYEDFVDQMTVGLRWLKETLDYVPSVAWHIDPFGHHASSAALFSQMGFNSFFFARIDYQDKARRLDRKELEMVWRPSQYDGDRSTFVFTHVNYYHYSPPPGFCFDDVCRDDPIMDDPALEGFNLAARADKFVEYFKSQGNHFRTANLMHTLGEDFTYTNSRMWFKNVDKLLKYINGRPEYGVSIQYSTPEDYMAAIQKEQATYPTKTDDFFPYADNEHAMWTGYFTSRVALKGFVKDMSRFTQSARKHLSELKISAASDIVKDNAKSIEETIWGMEMALGILQHHDGVSGTAKQHVTDDYIATGLRSIEEFNKLYKQVKKEEILKEVNENVSADDIYVNVFWNETGAVSGLSQKLNNNKVVLVNLYNSGPKGNFPIHFRVPNKDLNIVAKDNSKIPGDVICANFKDSNDCELIFYIDIEESSNTYIKISTEGGSAPRVPVKELTVVEQIKQFTLGSDKVKYTRGNQTFDFTINGKAESIKLFYKNYDGYDLSGQKSGAYIFRPKSDTAKLYSNTTKHYYADGRNIGMIILEGNRAITRVYFPKAADLVRNFGFKVETQLDSIPVSDHQGKQVTLNIQTNKNNNRTFFTDSMGLEEQKRTLDYRPTWNYTVFEPTAGNYYPVNAFIGIKDINTNATVTVVSDRSQGGSVLRQGEIELMIHRRLLQDDGRGVGEPLNELDSDKQGLRQTFRHYVVFGNGYRDVQKWMDQRVLPSWAVSQSSTFASVNIRQAPIKVPSSVKLYLRPYEDGSYLLRLHNFNPTEKISVSLDDGWKLTEYTLAYNQLLSDWKSKQVTWNEESSPKEKVMNKAQELLTDISQTLEEKMKPHLLTESTSIELREFEMKAFKLTKA